MRELILGGARSGKSRYAEQRALQSRLEVVYFATAGAEDDEMQRRIVHHRERRPADWALVEEPLALAAALEYHAAAGRCLLVDCLTLWLSNLLAAGDERLRNERGALLATLPGLPGRIVLVSNEVGQGVVPRRFVDEAGWLHQALAEYCEQVVFVTAGLAQTLKEAP